MCAFSEYNDTSTKNIQRDILKASFQGIPCYTLWATSNQSRIEFSCFSYLFSKLEARISQFMWSFPSIPAHPLILETNNIIYIKIKFCLKTNMSKPQRFPEAAFVCLTHQSHPRVSPHDSVSKTHLHLPPYHYCLLGSGCHFLGLLFSCSLVTLIIPKK